MKHFTRTMIAAGVLATLVFQQARADVVVIVSVDSTTTRLTPEQIARIFQGKSNTMTPVDIRPPSRIRSEFYTKVVGLDARVRAGWSKLLFTGKGSTPREFTQAEVVTTIAANPNAIGYVDRSFVNMTVKVIYTVK
jgi:ABC-type phosphate transport system substrate-binding protein